MLDGTIVNSEIDEKYLLAFSEYFCRESILGTEQLCKRIM